MFLIIVVGVAATVLCMMGWMRQESTSNFHAIADSRSFFNGFF
jgi:hypothetical protein